MGAVPANTITLQEAYSLFRAWIERDVPELPPRPYSHFDKFFKSPNRTKMSNSALYECSNIPVSGNEIERIMEPHVDWWTEVDGRNLKAKSVFKTYLENGSLEVRVYDQNTDRELRITQAEWRDQKLTFGGLLSPFDSEVISQPTGDPLADYNGWTPYIDRKDFDRWLKCRKKIDNRHGRIAPDYDWPSFCKEAFRLLDEEGDIDAQVDPSWNQSALEKRMASWCDKTWGKQPSESTVRSRVVRAMKEFRKQREADT
jgi:hypothetical protein